MVVLAAFAKNVGDVYNLHAVDHELLFAMLTKAQGRQHHTDAETRYKNVNTNHTQTIHKLYTTQI